MSADLRIAVIGCGAVSEMFHLPALAGIGRTPAWLIDKNRERAERLAKGWGGTRAASDYQACLGKFDAAIVALPHHLHAPVCSDLLARGVHLLVEKPLANTSAECETILSSAKQGGSVLAVGLMRRFLHVAQWVKAALEAGVLGEIESFDVREGFVYGWPVASDFFFRKETAGGGVLLDTGAHTLDLLLAWLGEAQFFEYRDDDFGGVEADCELRLTLASGAKGVVELSRTRNLRNTARIRGSKGEIEVGLTRNTLEANPRSLLRFKAGKRDGRKLPEQKLPELFRLQLEDWLEAITAGRPPRVSGSEGARAIHLIEACYAKRQRLNLPWVSPVEDRGRDKSKEVVGC